MGRHKKPPRKCGSETCDRTITTRSLCARCQKRKQRARNKQRNAANTSASGGLGALTQQAAASQTMMAPTTSLSRIATMPTPSLGQPFVLAMATPPAAPPLPPITAESKVHLEQHELTGPQAARARHVPMEIKPGTISVTEPCECCPSMAKAVINGHAQCLRCMFSGGVTAELIDQVDDKGNTIFHTLAEYATLYDRDYETILKILLKNTSEEHVQLYMNHKNDRGETPLFVASRFHSCGTHDYRATDATLIARVFLQHGADPNAMDLEGCVPLYDTTWQITRLLLQHRNVDSNVQCKNGNTPLHRAAAMLRPDVVHELLTEGQARVNIVNSMGQTPQDLAATANYALFEDAGVSIREFERDQQLTLQQLHAAGPMHVSLSPMHPARSSRLVHPPVMQQPSVGGAMGLAALGAGMYHPHHHHGHPPHHAHPHDLHHHHQLQETHHHTHQHHLGHPLAGYPHANPMGE